MDRGVLRPKQQRHKDLPVHTHAHWSVSVSLTSRLQWRDVNIYDCTRQLFTVCAVVVNLPVSSISSSLSWPPGESGLRPPTALCSSVHLTFPLLAFFIWVRKTRSLLSCTTSASSRQPAEGGGAEAEGSAATETYDVLLHLAPLFWLLWLSDQPHF